MPIDVRALLRDLEGTPREDEDAHRELVVDRKTGQARQAGASLADGAWVKKAKARAEVSLYYFCKAVLDQFWFTKELHLPLCRHMTNLPAPESSIYGEGPKRRKLILYPRHHGKTTLMHGLVLHMIMQPADGNVYFPGLEGSDSRILLCGETEGRAMKALGVVQGHAEQNEILRAFWPHRLWDNPKRESKSWNATELIFPRTRNYPDPTVRAVGVGGAIAGAHPNALIKDDLVTLKAASSEIVMEAAIEWHAASRALTVGIPDALEYIVGTRWHVHDLYDEIQNNDNSVEVYKRAIVEDGQIIYPAQAVRGFRFGFTAEDIEQLQKPSPTGVGDLFPLLYMNDPSDARLVDLDSKRLRSFKLFADEGRLVFVDDDEKDGALAELMNVPAPVDESAEQNPMYGMPINQDTWESTFDHRKEYFRTARAT